MLKITPELVKPSEDGQEVFYRYGIGDTHKMWFTQNQKNGNIYSVSLTAKQGIKDEFEYYITDDGRDVFYPNRFVLRGPSRNMTVHEAGAFIEQMKFAQDLIWTVQNFFERGPHAVKYWTERAKEHMDSIRLGDYDLDGVEITDDDYVNIGRRVAKSREPLSDAVHQYLLSVREVLDNGLDDIEEEI